MAPRPARVGAYLPPHLRAGHASATVQQRSLDELTPLSIQIRVEFKPGGPFSLAGCPDPVIDHQQADPSSSVQGGAHTSHLDTAAPGLECVVIESPACPDGHQMSELLDWFAAASAVPELPGYPQGDPRAVLSLPASLSKYERARWHAAAQKLGLASQSTGIGAGRFLQIRNKTTADQQPASDAQPEHQQPHPSSSSTNTTAGAAASSHQKTSTFGDDSRMQSPHAATVQSHDRRSRKSWQRVKQVWEWCQAEGGAFWNYSQNEVSQLLEQQDQMPDDLAQLIQKRESSQALCRALQNQDEAAALAVLCAAPSGSNLAWVRDHESGGYPAHIAAYYGLGKVLQQLVDTHGVNILQQHDARRNTPISLAQQQGHQQLAAHLEQIRLAGLGTAAGSPGLGYLGSSVTDSSKSEPEYSGTVSNNSGQTEADVLKTAAALSRLQVHSTAACCSSGVTSTSTQNADAAAMAIGSDRVPVSGRTPGSAVVAEQQQCVRYCSYETKKDRSFALFGRTRGTKGHRGGGGSGRGENVAESTDRRAGW